ncbi:conserved hypothetical protein [Candidatus Terasakiella magnetica]|nr:conserved hypothetical protein [Candidatus Terasakiella magnetica]
MKKGLCSFIPWMEIEAPCYGSAFPGQDNQALTTLRRLLTACCIAFPITIDAAVAAVEHVVISHIENDVPTTQGFRILREAYRRLGIEATEQFLPHERSLRHADNGETDGDVMRMAGLEASYPGLVRVPEPLVSFNAIAFTTGLTFTVNGWDSLRPYTICIARGMKMAERNTEGFNRMLANNVEQLLAMLRHDRCQVGVMGPASWLEIDRLKIGPLKALEPPITSIPLYHYVNRRHADLAPRLAEVLRQMRRDGTIETLLQPETQPIQDARQRNSLQ